SFWSAAGVTPTGGLSDPRIIYDHASGRWFAAEIDLGNPTGQTNNFLLAVSATSDPTGTWRGVKVDPNPNFADFDTLGLDATGVYMASNDFTTGGASLGQDTIVSFPKADLLLATPSAANRVAFSAQSTGTRGVSLQPVID